MEKYLKLLKIYNRELRELEEYLAEIENSFEISKEKQDIETLEMLIEDLKKLNKTLNS